jgi:Alginate lyase
MKPHRVSERTKANNREKGMKGWVLLALLLACHGNLAGAEDRLPRTFVFDPKTLADHRAAYRAGDKRYEGGIQNLRSDAEKALKTQPLSVIQKPQTPPSGDKHDYLSRAPYYWPQPTTRDGMPYVRRDGEHNPEVNRIPDRGNLEKLVQDASTLSLATYFTGYENYAAHAAKLLRVWFLDFATRMNPNLNYAQVIKGQDRGRAAGIIETHLFAVLVDAVGLLEGSHAGSSLDYQGMRQWLDAYLRWLRESANGRREDQAKNNQGSWYDAQVVSLALFLQKDSLAREVLEASKSKRIALQIEPDGKQPEELRRTRSLSYSLFNLEALGTLAALGERLDIDLWKFQTPDGKSIRRALELVLPALTGKQKWPYAQITSVDPSQYAPLVYQAARKYRARRYQLAYE